MQNFKYLIGGKKNFFSPLLKKRTKETFVYKETKETKT